LDEWIDTSRFVYNKAVKDCEQISIEERNSKTTNVNFHRLRNKFVTERTRLSNDNYEILGTRLKTLKRRLDEIDGDPLFTEEFERSSVEHKTLKKEQNGLSKTKNYLQKDWELNTPNKIRAFAVKEVETAYKGNFTKLKKGLVRFFKIKFRKKTAKSQSIQIPKDQIKLNDDGKLVICPKYTKEHRYFSFGNYNTKIKNLQIDHDCKIVREDGKYFVCIPIDCKEPPPLENSADLKFCGIDPGVRDFMTVFGNSEFKTISHKTEVLKKMNKQIDILKKLRKKKKFISKREKRKGNLVNELHYETVNHLVASYDVIFYGDIKSHNIVRRNKNSTLNRDFNDLKFFQFKQRLESKAKSCGKKVFPVHEANTSKTCSSCGKIYCVGKDKVYDCSNCKKKVDRDMNAAKNILMKGLLANFKIFRSKE
jgi:IS605 OrfB family transposase